MTRPILRLKKPLRYTKYERLNNVPDPIPHVPTAEEAEAFARFRTHMDEVLNTPANSPKITAPQYGRRR